MVRQLISPRPLVVAPWFSLATETGEVDQQRACAEAVLAPHSQSEIGRPASQASQPTKCGARSPSSLADRSEPLHLFESRGRLWLWDVLDSP